MMDGEPKNEIVSHVCGIPLIVITDHSSTNSHNSVAKLNIENSSYLGAHFRPRKTFNRCSAGESMTKEKHVSIPKLLITRSEIPFIPIEADDTEIDFDIDKVLSSNWLGTDYEEFN